MVSDAYLARLAADAYLGSSEFEAKHPNAIAVHLNGTEAYLVDTPYALVVAFRGTEIRSWRDLLTDARFKLKDAGSFEGTRVHTGFSVALDQVWPDILGLAREHGKPVVITGHSLGGALEALCGARMAVAGVDVQAIVTFGQPRVGNRDFVRLMQPLEWRRYVHLSDIVTRVPFWSMTYRHGGELLFIDRAREVWESPDVLKIWREQILSGSRLFSDHAAKNYLAANSTK
jgi:hypothetical protein